MTDRLSPQREAEILKFRDQCHPVTGVLSVGRVHAALNDLLAELAAVRKERDEARERAESARTEAIADVGDWLDEIGQKDAAYLVRTVDIPAGRDMRSVPKGGAS